MPRPERPWALVTGASRGIGRAIALRLAGDHRLILSARDHDALTALAAELALEPDAVRVIASDLADPEGRRALTQGIAEHPSPVQVLVNNAGLAISTSLPRTDDATWERLVATNLTAPFELCRAALPRMLEAGWGRIVNVASTAALKGYRYTSAYAATKAGLLGFGRSLAAEVAGRGVTVHTVCPGFTDTALVQDAISTITRTTGRTPEAARAELERFSPLGRLVTPGEIATAVAYLVSDAGESQNGHALVLDGGEVVL